MTNSNFDELGGFGSMHVLGAAVSWNTHRLSTLVAVEMVQRLAFIANVNIILLQKMGRWDIADFEFKIDRLDGDVIADLVNKFGKRTFLLQEVGSWPEDPTIEGWFIFHKEFSKAAIVLPSGCGASIRWRRDTGSTSAVLLEQLGILSVYLADSGKPLEEYEDRWQK